MRGAYRNCFHIQRFSICSVPRSQNSYSAPCLLIAFIKSSKQETWWKYGKGIDVMQPFSCSPSCLFHYSTEHYKQNNHKNSLTGTWGAWWADLHSPVLHNRSFSPVSPSLSPSLSLSFYTVSLFFFLGHGAFCSISGSLKSRELNSHFSMWLMYTVSSGLFLLWDVLPMEKQCCH